MENHTEDEKAHAFLQGTRLIEKAFNANQRSAAAANALCELFLRKGNYPRVCSFPETTDVELMPFPGAETCGAYYTIR